MAGDPLRPRRPADRPRARRGVPGARGDRAAARVDRAGARASSASTRSFPERNGAQRQRAMIEAGATPRGGVRGVGAARRAQTYSAGGAGMSTEPSRGAEPAGGRAERGGAARGLRGGAEPHHGHRHDRPGGRLAAQHRRRGGSGRRSAGRGAPGAPQRDLEQVRDAIDGARGAAGDPRAQDPAASCAPLRDALSQLQMAYAREVAARGGAPGAAPAGAPGARASGAPAQRPAGAARPASEPPRSRPSRRAGPGPAESSGRLWVPGQLTRARPRAPLAGTSPAGTIDCAPRLHRVDARARAIRPSNVRANVLARHANQTAEDFC